MPCEEFRVSGFQTFEKCPHCIEISISVIPENELCVLSPNFHIHVSVSDLYILTMGPPIFLQQNRQTDRGNTYINRQQKHECRNWNCGLAVPSLRIFVSNFRYCVIAVHKTHSLKLQMMIYKKNA